MFTICTRCQFRVPVRARLCQVCGNERTTRLAENLEGTQLHAQRQILFSMERIGNWVWKALAANKDRFLTGIKRHPMLQPQLNSSLRPPGAPPAVLAVSKTPSARLAPRSFHIARTTKGLDTTSPIPEPELPKARYRQAFEAASTRKKLEELQGWFEDYGRDGIIKNQYDSREDMSKTA